MNRQRRDQPSIPVIHTGTPLYLELELSLCEDSDSEGGDEGDALGSKSREETQMRKMSRGNDRGVPDSGRAGAVGIIARTADESVDSSDSNPFDVSFRLAPSNTSTTPPTPVSVPHAAPKTTSSSSATTATSATSATTATTATSATTSSRKHTHAPQWTPIRAKPSRQAYRAADKSNVGDNLDNLGNRDFSDLSVSPVTDIDTHAVSDIDTHAVSDIDTHAAPSVARGTATYLHDDRRDSREQAGDIETKEEGEGEGEREGEGEGDSILWSPVSGNYPPVVVRSRKQQLGHQLGRQLGRIDGGSVFRPMTRSVSASYGVSYDVSNDDVSNGP